MANTAALVFQGHNHLRYLVTADEAGGAFTIANDAGASPDLQTDSLAGPIKQIAQARATGIGTVAAGALTQAQARALLLADSAAANVGGTKVPRCIVTATPRLTGIAMTVDANVDGDGDPIITGTITADGFGYVDVHFIGGIGTV
jgi:hypothetical protein